MRLTYTGSIAAGQWLPGEPAADHDEPDAARAAEKLKSGFYVKAKHQVAAPTHEGDD